MARTFLTAREQVELLSPWRTASWDDQIEHSGGDYGGYYWIPRGVNEPSGPPWSGTCTTTKNGHSRLQTVTVTNRRPIGRCQRKSDRRCRA